MLILAVFVPFAFVLARRYRFRQSIPLIVVGFSFALPFAWNGYSLEQVAVKAVAQIEVPANFVLVDGKDLGYPTLGRGFITPQRLDAINSFRAALDTLRKPGETYFDLTNSSGMHLMLNLRYPSPYPYFLAVTAAIQERIIKRLSIEKPAVVWVAPAMDFDRGVASLRAYRVYRWFVMQGYRYVNVGNYGFLLSAERYQERFPSFGTKPQVSEGLVSVFHRPELDSLPIAWGKSFDRLSALVEQQALAFSSVENPKKDGNTRVFDIVLEKELEGKSSDYLLLKFDIGASQHPTFKAILRWKDAEGAYEKSQGFRFSISAGTLVVPLASDPRWLLGRVKNVQLKVLGIGSRVNFRLQEIAALRLK